MAAATSKPTRSGNRMYHNIDSLVDSVLTTLLQVPSAAWRRCSAHEWTLPRSPVSFMPFMCVYHAPSTFCCVSHSRDSSRKSKHPGNCDRWPIVRLRDKYCCAMPTSSKFFDGVSSPETRLAIAEVFRRDFVSNLIINPVFVPVIISRRRVIDYHSPILINYSSIITYDQIEHCVYIGWSADSERLPFLLRLVASIRSRTSIFFVEIDFETCLSWQYESA